ncbi:MAG TPA: hypothetical protein VFB45_10055 [Pseudolabrys sp.]|nr:hypothetical protein [Pseudolabrys sp.]
MAQVFFHYSTESEFVVDAQGIHVEGLRDAREQASRAINALIAEPNQEDWRNWTVHVTDELGEEIFNMPFTSVLGEPN